MNCSGLGSRGLVHDTTTTPVRGQVVMVEQFGLEEWWLTGEGPTYVVPRSADIVVGGTDDAGEWDRRPSSEVADDILRRATDLVPELAGARVHRAPGRPTSGPSRRTPGARGGRHPLLRPRGAGVTLSWGCADEVAALAG